MDGYGARQAAAKGVRGFTLVELMIVLIIVSVLVSLGSPSMQRLRDKVRVRTEVSRIFSDIVYTRSEAIKRNISVIMCPSSMASSGEKNCSGGFAGGWVVFVDADRNRELSEADQVLKAAPGLTPEISLTNRAASREANELIQFRPDGTSRRNRTLMFCSRRDPKLKSFSVVMNMIGRPRVERDWGECPVS